MDMIYLVFIFLSLYFTILFLVIFIDARKTMLSDELPKKYPPLTVIVPVHNKAKDIAEVIRCLKASKYPQNKLKIIVINDASTDSSGEILSKIRGIKVITNIKNLGKAASLNKALRYVQSEFVAVVDGDSFVDVNALSHTMGVILEDDMIGGVTVAITAKKADNFLQRLQDIEYSMIVWVRKLLQTIEAIYVTPGPLAMYRTKVLKEIGGFDEKNITEDIEIAWRIMYYGYKIRLSLKSRVFVEVHTKLYSWWRQRLRWALGGLQTFLKYKHTFLRPKYGMLGKFVVPYFLLTVFISLSGFAVFIHRVGMESLRTALSFISPQSGAQFFSDAFFLPSLYLFYGTTIFILFLFYTYLGLRTMNNTKYLQFKRMRIVNLIIYLTMYVTVFPVVLMAAMYRLLRGDMSWY